MAMRIILCLCLFILVTGAGGQDMTSAAQEFLFTLDPAEKSETMFPFQDTERFNMNFVPMPRKGPTFHDFNESQKRRRLRC